MEKKGQAIVRLLVVEDDPTARMSLVMGLRHMGDYDVHAAESGEKALEVITGGADIDLVILDYMLPGIDGVEVCQRIRQISTVPIIFLSALGEDHHVIAALERGADDYLLKPARTRILDTRIRAVLRRSDADYRSVIARYGRLILKEKEGMLLKDGRPVTLSRTDFALISLMIRRREQLLSRQELLEQVWRKEYLGDSRLVDVAVGRLRLKLEDDPANPQYVQTVRGKGYRLGPI